METILPFIIFVSFFLVVYTFIFLNYKKRNKANKLKVDNFLKENTEVSKVNLIQKSGHTYGALSVLSVDNDVNKIVGCFEGRMPVIFLKPGVNKLKVKYNYTKNHAFSNSKTHMTIGPINVEVNVDPNAEYDLSYSVDNNKFNFDKKEEK